MSIKLVDRVFGTECKSPTEKLVLLAIANRINEKSGVCWPSIPRLSKDTGLSERAIYKALSSLKRQGLLAWQKGRLGVTNRYRLLLPPPAPRSGGYCNTDNSTLNHVHPNRNNEPEVKTEGEASPLFKNYEDDYEDVPSVPFW